MLQQESEFPSLLRLIPLHCVYMHLLFTHSSAGLHELLSEVWAL